MRGRLFICFLFVASSSRATIVSYDADQLPELVGWSRDQDPFPADRSLEDGWLVQYAEIIPQKPPLLDISEDDVYRRLIAEFTGTNEFFVEWRLQTDGPREGFPNVSPAALVVSGTSRAFYHFTIANDQARYIDADLTVRLFDIIPDVPHIYRLELFGTESYRWLIDGQVVFEGIPAGPYPTADSKIVFGARAAGQPITARWDYIRYGVIPEDGSGDYDSDGFATLDDFYFVHECLTNDRPGINGGPGNDAGPGCRFADFDFDADTDLFDFAEFQNLFGHPLP